MRRETETLPNIVFLQELATDEEGEQRANAAAEGSEDYAGVETVEEARGEGKWCVARTKMSLGESRWARSTTREVRVPEGKGEGDEDEGEDENDVAPGADVLDPIHEHEKYLRPGHAPTGNSCAGDR